MKYRKLDVDGDYEFGAQAEFLSDSPLTVAQAIYTRLLLNTGEWFLDVNEGTPYSTDVVGYGTQATRDPAIQERIINTPGVLELVSYSSQVDSQRRFTVNARVRTAFGDVQAAFAMPTPGTVPPPPPPAPAQPFDVDLDADLNAGPDPSNGITVSGLDPLTIYQVTQPAARLYTAWQPDIVNFPNLYRNLFSVTTPVEAERVIGAGSYGSVSGYGTYTTANAARAGFIPNTITGSASYTFWFNDSPHNDNAGGVSLHMAPVTFVGALDSYTTNLFAVIGLNRLLTSYSSGPLVRVRRDGDDAEADISFTANGALDTTTLLTFVGTDSAYVTRWYDQSGAGNHFVNATNSEQPRIVDSGVYEACVRFNLLSLDDNLLCANNGGAVAAKTIFRHVKCRARATFAFPYEYGDGSLIGTAGADGECQYLDGSGANQGLYAAGTGVGFAAVVAWITPSQGHDPSLNFGVSAHVLKRQQSPASLGLNVYQNGALSIPNSFVDAVGLPGNFPAYKWRLACRSDGGNGAQVDMVCCAIYDSDRTAQLTQITAALS